RALGPERTSRGNDGVGRSARQAAGASGRLRCTPDEAGRSRCSRAVDCGAAEAYRWSPRCPASLADGGAPHDKCDQRRRRPTCRRVSYPAILSSCWKQAMLIARPARLLRVLYLLPLMLAACSGAPDDEEALASTDGILRFIPADTPYVFAT